MIRYRFYPSLLDSFQDYLDADKIWEKYWGNSEEPSVSLDDFLAKAESELIEKINRVPHEPIEAADKGTCFNEIIDRINSGGRPFNDAVELQSLETRCVVVGECDETGKPIYADVEEIDCPHIEAKMDGFTFLFDIATCKNAAAYFNGALPQHFCKSVLTTFYGDVELYGYVDEIKADKVYDIKTTSGSYEYGKFQRYWQWRAYPYCLVNSGEMSDVSEFEYTVFVLNKKEPYTAQMYRECYPYVQEKAEEELRLICERFIEFLEIHKDEITDKKIFNSNDYGKDKTNR